MRIKEMTSGVGVDSVLECVGTQESMKQAIDATRPGGSIGYVGVPHRVMLDGADLFFRHVHLHGVALASREPETYGVTSANRSGLKNGFATGLDLTSFRTKWQGEGVQFWVQARVGNRPRPATFTPRFREQVRIRSPDQG